MSIPATQDNFTYVLPGRQTILQVLFQTYEWSGQEQPVSDVAITIRPVAGGATVVGPTSDGIVTIDSATYSYTWQPDITLPAGDYLVEQAASRSARSLPWCRCGSSHPAPAYTPLSSNTRHSPATP